MTNTINCLSKFWWNSNSEHRTRRTCLLCKPMWFFVCLPVNMFSRPAHTIYRYKYPLFVSSLSTNTCLYVAGSGWPILSSHFLLPTCFSSTSPSRCKIEYPFRKVNQCILLSDLLGERSGIVSRQDVWFLCSIVFWTTLEQIQVPIQWVSEVRVRKLVKVMDEPQLVLMDWSLCTEITYKPNTISFLSDLIFHQIVIL